MRPVGASMKASHGGSAPTPFVSAPPLRSTPLVARLWPLFGEVDVEKPLSAPRPAYAYGYLPCEFFTGPLARPQAPPPPIACWPRGGVPRRWNWLPPSVE